MSASEYPMTGGAPRGGTPTSVRPASAKTSAAATFALVFGVSGLLSVLTAILAPVGLVLGLIGVVLGIVAFRMTSRPGVTGRGVTIGGLVLSILAVLLGLAFAAGVTTFINDEGAVDRLERQVGDLRDRL